MNTLKLIPQDIEENPMTKEIKLFNTLGRQMMDFVPN